MPPSARPHARDAGFTLLEVLVALVVLSTTVVAALQLFGGGLRLARTAGDHSEAALLASAKLSDLEPGPLTEGQTDGTDGPYRWTRRVTLDAALLPIEADSP
jgi:prepilin-type N-terminal cleavage/methylation domain-containing protein